MGERGNGVFLAKHSGATCVDVRLSKRNKGLEVGVRDNGAGFDPADATAQGTGRGLKSMKGRVKLSGGTLTITSGPNRGTDITARWKK